MTKQKVSFFWFRRDLRLEDNTGLFHALQSDFPVIPLFIFDDEILENLPKNDARVQFILESLQKINEQLKAIDSSILIKKGTTSKVWESLTTEFDIQHVFFNKDYEPFAIKRDAAALDGHQAHERFEQRGLAHAVAAHDSRALAPEGEAQIIE